MLNNKTILIVGASGYLGQEITRLAEPLNQVIPTHFQHPVFEHSIQFDFFQDQIDDCVDLTPVDIIIFAGAVEFQATDQVESSMERFAQACNGKRVIYLSSDGIFDGSRGGYEETDIPQPKTLYGRNLATCEAILSASCQNLCIVRPSYIYGFANGNLDNRLAKTAGILKSGGSVSLFDDMYKSPLGVSQVAQAVLDMAELKYTGVVHVAGERLSVYEFQRLAMETLGINKDKLNRNSMPIEKKGFLRDTSLNSSLWQQLTNTYPMGIKETLSHPG